MKFAEKLDFWLKIGAKEDLLLTPHYELENTLVLRGLRQTSRKNLKLSIDSIKYVY